MALEWKAPPTTSGRQRSTADPDVIAELSEHPGSWAVVETGMHPYDARALAKAFKDAGCEVVTRRTTPAGDERDVYARIPAETEPDRT